jgi:hypothetical protein
LARRIDLLAGQVGIVHRSHWIKALGMRLGPVVGRFIGSSQSSPAYLGRATPAAALAAFLALALELPEATTGTTYPRGDVRVRGSLFFAIPDDKCVLLKLEQGLASRLSESEPDRYGLADGELGRDGWVRIVADGMPYQSMKQFVRASWCAVAPAELAEERCTTERFG